MWYLVSAGIGVVLGLALLIFALRERSAKHAAERLSDGLGNKLTDEQEKHEGTRKLLIAAQHELRKSVATQDLLRSLVEQARTRLASCRDPKVVKSWLDNELSDKDV